jgi:hypothetical protein
VISSASASVKQFVWRLDFQDHTMSVSALNTITPASLLIPVSGSGSTANTSSTSPVVASNDAGLAAQVSALSTDSGVIATLGSSTSSQVYDAAGLYNSIAQAGTSTTIAATSGTGSSTSTDSGTSGAIAQFLDSFLAAGRQL